MLADEAVATDPSSTGAAATTTAQKNGGWFGFISNAMEVVLKVLKDGLTVVYVSYAFGFAIILLTAILEDGHLPLGWSDTMAFLVLPVLLVVSQYVSMEIMKPPQTDDPASKYSLRIFKFLPLMISYFALSVPSGLGNLLEEVLEEANSSPGKPIPDYTGPRKGKRSKRQYMITVVQKVACDSCATSGQ